LVDDANRKSHEGAVVERKSVDVKLVDVKLAVSALLAQSGEIAPVDVVRFGKCAGEIIAGSVHRQRF
jgi:hypothetical protein